MILPCGTHCVLKVISTVSKATGSEAPLRVGVEEANQLITYLEAQFAYGFLLGLVACCETVYMMVKNV